MTPYEVALYIHTNTQEPAACLFRTSHDRDKGSYQATCTFTKNQLRRLT